MSEEKEKDRNSDILLEYMTAYLVLYLGWDPRIRGPGWLPLSLLQGRACLESKLVCSVDHLRHLVEQTEPGEDLLFEIAPDISLEEARKLWEAVSLTGAWRQRPADELGGAAWQDGGG